MLGGIINYAWKPASWVKEEKVFNPYSYENLLYRMDTWPDSSFAGYPVGFLPDIRIPEIEKKIAPLWSPTEKNYKDSATFFLDIRPDIHPDTG